jgi:hypothetical protein
MCIAELKASPDAVIEIGAVRYVLAGLVVALAVVSFLLGFLSHRPIVQ